MQRFTIKLLLLFLLPSFAFSQKVDFVKLDSLITRVDRFDKMMGALTISKNGKIIYSKAWGYRAFSEQERLKSNTDTRYRIGSITKMFTAVMILQLVEEGKIQLSDKLAKYYPEIPNAEKISIAQMLNHHSGLYNFTDTSYLRYHTQAKSQKELLSLFASQTPVFAPGERAEYSNTNFVLLGYIVEQVTGDSYAANLKKRITGKTGLKNTRPGGKINPANNEASSFGYYDKTWLTEPETDMSIPGGAGCITSTTSDLVKFIEALFRNKLLKPATLAKMLTLTDGYGYGIFQFPFDEKTAYGHTGGIDEFHSVLGYFPKDSIAFAFTGNAANIDMNDLVIGVLSICFNRHYELPDYAVHAYALAAEELAKYEGTYASEDIPLKIVLRKVGDKLTAQATGQGAFSLTPVSPREFRFEPAQISMIFEDSGALPVTTFTLRQAGGKYIFRKE